MHVLVIPSWYPKNKNDIGGSFFREQALALSRANVKVGIIYVDLISLRNIKSIKDLDIRTTIEIDESVPTIRYRGIAWLPKIPYGNSLLVRYYGYKLYKKYCNLYGTPDVVHVHSALYGGCIAQYIKKRGNVPYVVTEHSSLYGHEMINSWKKKIAKNIFMNSNYNIAVSKPFSRLLNNYFGDIPHLWSVIPNILNKNFSDAFKQEDKKSQNDKFIFLHISLLDKNKNIPILLKSFAKVYRGRENFELLIGGDGPERSYLELLAKSLGLENQVSFLGKLSRSDIVHYYQMSNVFVLSSNFETFGVVVIEALSQGLPVVATKCGGPEDLINNENGILVSKDNLIEMINALKYIYKNYDKYDHKAIRTNCIKKFGEEVVINQLKLVYKGLP